MRRLTGLALLVPAAMLGTIPVRADLPPFPHPRPRLPTCQIQPVRSVDHAEIARGPVPKLRASGAAASAGWKNPQLRFVTVTDVRTDRATAVNDFVGCEPRYFAAQVLTPMTAETEITLYPENGRIRFVRVKAATNSIQLTLDAPGQP